MSECPYCHRRLLSQGSPKCNWCGREIPDAAYQQRAAVQREAFFAEQALHDAVSLARIEAINAYDPLLAPLDPLTGLPLGALLPPHRPVPPAPPPVMGSAPGPEPNFGHAYNNAYNNSCGAPEPTAEPAPPEEETAPEPENGGRFGHLEL